MENSTTPMEERTHFLTNTTYSCRVPLWAVKDFGKVDNQDSSWDQFAILEWEPNYINIMYDNCTPFWVGVAFLVGSPFVLFLGILIYNKAAHSGTLE